MLSVLCHHGLQVYCSSHLARYLSHQLTCVYLCSVEFSSVSFFFLHFSCFFFAFHSFCLQFSYSFYFSLSRLFLFLVFFHTSLTSLLFKFLICFLFSLIHPSCLLPSLVPYFVHFPPSISLSLLFSYKSSLYLFFSPINFSFSPTSLLSISHVLCSPINFFFF